MHQETLSEINYKHLQIRANVLQKNRTEKSINFDIFVRCFHFSLFVVKIEKNYSLPKNLFSISFDVGSKVVNVILIWYKFQSV